ncbi:unnamed protein product [Phyllotreta striolata]|uniref:protein-tyrosine-phosphatase n=1 Tax=Phyllotreta striolata TaxID=444603 RepID=A0A9N9XT46_PHYSR|nr:unnamed protein product [Phyllotreta striolata]
MNKFTNTPKEIDHYVEIINKQLYFAVLKEKQIIKLKNNATTLFFCIDQELVYDNYYNDFGPLNVSCFYKYSYKLKKYLQFANGTKIVVHYTCDDPEKKANAACLMGCFSVMYLNFHPKEIWCILQELGPYKNYSDASQQVSSFTLKIKDCLQALQKALMYNFINFDDFNVVEYDLYNKLQYGDMNWLIPRKFLAFIGPAENYSAHPPEFYLKYFLKNDVKTIIRLNNPLYNSQVFTQLGIQHFDLIFRDGSTPPKEILMKFLSIAEMAPAAIGVHCKAGLGRTGSLIGAYIVKHYMMTAREAIAWMRLCRPGSVIGQQQKWLEKLESWLWKTGSQYRIRQYGADKIPKHKYGIYSKEWPMERERIITDAKRKIQDSFTSAQMERTLYRKRISSSTDSFTRNSVQVSRRVGSSNSFKMGINSKSQKSNQCEAKDASGMWEPVQAKFSNFSSVESHNAKKRRGEMCVQSNWNRNSQGTQGDKLNLIKANWGYNMNEIRGYSSIIPK